MSRSRKWKGTPRLDELKKHIGAGLTYTEISKIMGEPYRILALTRSKYLHDTPYRGKRRKYDHGHHSHKIPAGNCPRCQTWGTLGRGMHGEFCTKCWSEMSEIAENTMGNIYSFTDEIHGISKEIFPFGEED